MTRQPLFADLLTNSPDLAADLAKVAVAADLTVLLAQSGRSRADLAKKLGWTRARVTQVLSGEGNLTIETLHAVAQALGQRFDIVFRKAHERRMPQAWERGVVLTMHECSSTTKHQTVLRDSFQSTEQSMGWLNAA